MAKVAAAAFIFIAFVMAILIVAFDSNFLDQYYHYETLVRVPPAPSMNPGQSSPFIPMVGRNISITREAWARDLRDKSQDDWPDMWRGLKASIAFSTITIFFTLIGLVVALVEAKPSICKIIGGLIVISLIALFLFSQIF